MSEERSISFEELNAFIDGELDAGAAARVLAAIDVDDRLKREACELRALRDQVRNSYEPARLGVGQRRGSFSAGRWPMALAAGLLLMVGALAGWQGHALQRQGNADGVWQRIAQVQPQGDARRLVLHVGDPDRARFENTLDEVRGMLRAAHGRGQAMELEILANGTGLNLLRAQTTPFAERLAQLQAEFPELSLVACGQGLNRLQGQGNDIRLIPGVVTADSALDEIVRRMNQGWAYLRV
ncbi:MAG: hypothetical protein KJ787_11590 [Gammaproteobacteria bacterium]|nr:hypothetical protein [Gammaproteobacteria bacterium]MBU1646963.1 hypothetical protein [Gammaproteobacteria bacterium]MBU1972475.1 hypothetical protein [Gammaproteobacteria bacterium]